MKRLILSLVSFLAIIFASQATLYTVNVTTDNNAGAGTIGDLRYCINQAAGNAAGPHTIIFTVPAGSTITLNSTLTINGSTNLAGLTINGFIDAFPGPDVLITSTQPTNFYGFQINNNITGLTIYGLAFNNLKAGIWFNNCGVSTGSSVQGCYFGTNIGGTAIQNGTYQDGILLTGTSGVTIGGTSTTLPNGAATFTNNTSRCIFGGTCQDIADNQKFAGVHFNNASNNTIIGNYFGVDSTGTVRLPIGNTTTMLPLNHHCVFAENSSTANTIDRNVLSGATGIGVYLEAGCNNTIIKGNFIGTDPTGTLGYSPTNNLTASFGNMACGIYLNGVTGCTVGFDGSATPNQQNTISGNGGARHTYSYTGCIYGWNEYNQIGIYAQNITNCKISGNNIGTDVTGLNTGTNYSLGNKAGGIKIISSGGTSTGNVIGGLTTSPSSRNGNVICGNGFINGINGIVSVWTPSAGVAGCDNTTSGIQGGEGITIQYSTTTNNTIIGNYIGLGSDGVTLLGNNSAGVDFQGAANNTLGGTTAGSANYIGGNVWGVMSQIGFQTAYPYNGDAPATGNIIIGNVIGLDINNNIKGNGISANANSAGEGGGICLQMGTKNTYIGQAVAGAGNVIAGNRNGITIRNANTANNVQTGPNGNFVYNNIIGMTSAGNAAPNSGPAPEFGNGITIENGNSPSNTVLPYNNTIGGTGSLQANFISANQADGIALLGFQNVTTPTAANIISGNYIGIGTDKSTAMGNGTNGIEANAFNLTTILSNIISSNKSNGILLTASSNNTIQNNTIGALEAPGSATYTSRGNGANGISLVSGTTLGSASNIIGGVNAGQPNAIANNTLNGVSISGTTSNLNSIHKNNFSCNKLRGVELNGTGNNTYAAPTIAGSPTAITFTGPAGSTIEVFTTDGCATCPANPTQLQGKTFVSSGASPYVITPVAGTTYTALSHAGNTTAAHNSSEFSTCYTLCSNPTVSVTGAPSLTFCQGGSVTLTANVSGGTGPFTYVWKQAGTVVGTNASTYVASAAGSYTVDVSSATSCSVVTSSAVTVTVNPNPIVTTPTTATICSGATTAISLTSSPSGATFAWTLGTVTGSVTGQAAGSGSSIAQTLTNSGTSAGTVQYIVTATANSCSGASTTITVTVNPKPVVTTATTATICSAATTAISLTSSTAGATYSWTIGTVTGSITGQAAGSGSSIAQTLTNAGTTAGTVQYIVTPTANGCTGTASTITVTVNPSPVVTTATTATICSGTSTAISLTSSTAGATYAWTIGTVTGSITGQAAGSGSSIAQTLTNTGTSAGTVQYVVTPTANTCAGAATTITVTVNPKAVVTTPITATICSGATTAISLTSSTTGATFSWTIGTVTGSVSGQSAGSGSTIAQTLTNAGTTAGTVQYIVTPTANGCTGTATTITVTVNPNPTVTTSANPAPICSGATTAINLTSSPAGSTFAWTIGTVTGSITGQVAGSGSTIAQTLTNPGTTAGTVQYLVTPTINGCSGSASTITVTVNPSPVLTTSQTFAICSGNTTSIPLTSGTSGTTYTWTIGTVTGSITGQAAGSGSTIAQTLTNGGSTNGTVQYIVTPTANGCAGSATTITVTINTAPTVTTPNPAVVCSGGTTSIALTSSPSGSTFAWTIGTVTGSVSGQSSGNGPTIAQTLNNAGTTAGTVQYIVTPTLSGCAAGSPTTITVTVNPNPTVTTATSATICSGGATTISLASSPAGSTFAWTIGTVTGNVTGQAAGSGSTIAQTLTDTDITAGTVQYIVTPTLNSCSGTATTITVTVNPNPALTNTTTATICSGSATSISLTSSPAGATFAWTIGTVTGNVTGQTAGNGSTIAQTLTDTDVTPGTVLYLVTPTLNGCAGSATTITVTINPNPVLSSPNTATICSGATTSIVLASSPSGSTFTWTIGTVTGSISGQSSGNGSTISQTLTDSDNQNAGTVQYLVVSTLNGCSGSANTITVTVNPTPPAPVITASGPVEFCIGGSVNLTASSTGYSGGTYNWTNGSTSLGTTNPLVVTASGTYTVTYTAVTSCGSGSASQVITVDNAPSNAVATATTPALCNVSTTTLSASVPSSGTGSWSFVPAYNNGTLSNTTSTNPSVTLNNGADTVKVIWSVVSGVCGASADTLTITKTTLVSPVISGGGFQCSDSTSTLTSTVDHTSSGSKYLWTVVSGDLTITSSNTINPITVKAGNNVSIITVTETFGACALTSANDTIRISPNNVNPGFVGIPPVTCSSVVSLISNPIGLGQGSGIWTSTDPSITIIKNSETISTASPIVRGNTYTFIYTVSGACGLAQSDTATVKAGLNNFTLAGLAAPKDTLCVGTPVAINASVSGGSGNYTYYWGSTDSTFSAKTKSGTIDVTPKVTKTTYYVIVVDNVNLGCSLPFDTVSVYATNGQDINFPNLITPNGDGLNDVFILKEVNPPYSPLIKDGSHLQVVNRWGDRVYETQNYDNTWGAKDLSDGVYFYDLKVKCGNKNHKGWVQVIGNTQN